MRALTTPTPLIGSRHTRRLWKGVADATRSKSSRNQDHGLDNQGVAKQEEDPFFDRYTGNSDPKGLAAVEYPYSIVDSNRVSRREIDGWKKNGGRQGPPGCPEVSPSHAPLKDHYRSCPGKLEDEIRIAVRHVYRRRNNLAVSVPVIITWRT